MQYKSRVRWERVAMSSLGRPIHLSLHLLSVSLFRMQILCVHRKELVPLLHLYTSWKIMNSFGLLLLFSLPNVFFAIVATRRLTHWSRGCLLHFYRNNLFPESDNIDARKKGSMMMWLWWMGFIFWVWRLMGWLVGKRGMNWAWICCS